MSQPMISVNNLSKEYVISHRPSYGTLRDSLTSFAAKPFRRKDQPKKELLTALNRVHFDVQAGERVGIIGRNGAGKSTLLKILSQITPPTSGSVTLRGRVASLLEVGTGFHAELTGRENIFLNGAILGMRQSEIRRKFDEIVLFAEVEKFLDTPVKRYSSGMYVRLAFAVAAHLESEILIVDEVLAVGDAQFQKKCISKMQDVSGTGRTVLFVSHNMSAITQLCERAILLREGRTIDDGKPNLVISNYFSTTKSSASNVDLISPTLRKNSFKNSAVKWKRISILDQENHLTDHLGFHDPFTLELVIIVDRPVKEVRMAFAIQSSLGFPVMNSFQDDGGLPSEYQPGTYIFRSRLNPNVLAPGLYEISLGAIGPQVTDWIPTALQFQVDTTSADGKKSWTLQKGGIIDLPTKWEMLKERTNI